MRCFLHHTRHFRFPINEFITTHYFYLLSFHFDPITEQHGTQEWLKLRQEEEVEVEQAHVASPSHWSSPGVRLCRNSRAVRRLQRAEYGLDGRVDPHLLRWLGLCTRLRGLLFLFTDTSLSQAGCRGSCILSPYTLHTMHERHTSHTHAHIRTLLDTQIAGSNLVTPCTDCDCTCCAN